MNIEIEKEIIEKAKIKNDGVYSHKKYKYVVVNHRFRAWCKYKEVYECFGAFNVRIGEISETYNRDKELKILLKQYQNEGR
jgi:hypothetical protein